MTITVASYLIHLYCLDGPKLFVYTLYLHQQVPLVAILTLYLMIIFHLRRNGRQRRDMGLTRPNPDGRRDLQCHQNGKLLLNEKRALRLMGMTASWMTEMLRSYLLSATDVFIFKC